MSRHGAHEHPLSNTTQATRARRVNLLDAFAKQTAYNH